MRQKKQKESFTPRTYFLPVHTVASRFLQVDCDNDGKELCQRFNIQGYPTLKLFRYGKYIGDYVGQRDRGEQIISHLEKTNFLHYETYENKKSGNY